MIRVHRTDLSMPPNMLISSSIVNIQPDGSSPPPYIAKLGCAIYGKPNGRDADGPRTQRLRRYPGNVCLRSGALAPGLRHQHVLHVADEGRQPQGLQGERGRISEEVQADP